MCHIEKVAQLKEIQAMYFFFDFPCFLRNFVVSFKLYDTAAQQTLFVRLQPLTTEILGLS
jgi:hypothetical protein